MKAQYRNRAIQGRGNRMSYQHTGGQRHGNIASVNRLHLVILGLLADENRFIDQLAVLLAARYPHLSPQDLSGVQDSVNNLLSQGLAGQQNNAGQEMLVISPRGVQWVADNQQKLARIQMHAGQAARAGLTGAMDKLKSALRLKTLPPAGETRRQQIVDVIEEAALRIAKIG